MNPCLFDMFLNPADDDCSFVRQRINVDFDRAFQGTVSVRYALQQSLNVPAVQMLERIGAQRFLAMLRQAGVSPALPRTGDLGGSLAIGLALLLVGFGALAFRDAAQLLFVGRDRNRKPDYHEGGYAPDQPLVMAHPPPQPHLHQPQRVESPLYAAVERLNAEMDEGRQRRLVRLGFPPGEAAAPRFRSATREEW